MTFCVLVTSADNRKDIFDMCFANSERIWKDCPWPRYAGFTTQQPDTYGFRMLSSEGAENWCEQVMAHVNKLPLEITYILLMVEDVLFMKPIDMNKIGRIAKYIEGLRLDYTQLVPLRDQKGASRLIQPIPRDHPYYSSTEMAIWRRDYLLKLLDQGSDAWSFEQFVWGAHYTVTEPILEQHQVVQKGRWNWDAPYLMAQVMNMPPTKAVLNAIADILVKTRPFQSIGARLRGHWQNLSFALFGFTSFRIKRWLKSRLPV